MRNYSGWDGIRHYSPVNFLPLPPPPRRILAPVSSPFLPSAIFSDVYGAVVVVVAVSLSHGGKNTSRQRRVCGAINGVG